MGWGMYIDIFMFCPIDLFQNDQFEFDLIEKFVGQNVNTRLYTGNSRRRYGPTGYIT